MFTKIGKELKNKTYHPHTMNFKMNCSKILVQLFTELLLVEVEESAC